MDAQTKGAGAERTVWQLLTLGDDELERADVVELNLAVARAIPSLKDLDTERYRETVDQWAARFARWLPTAERGFRQTPWKWKDDIRFFRVGMLAGFIGHNLGIRYRDDHKRVTSIAYTDPSDLFLNGLIDTKQGTCANMAALHVAISRRMAWPVSLACVKSHFVSRYDDGRVYHNIETTSDHPGMFASDPDEVYVERFKLPKKAVACGSDLRKLSAREMLGIFIALRARHFRDVGDMTRADADYARARVLAPRYRAAYVNGVVPMLKTGENLFERGELGHPDSLFEDLAPVFAPHRAYTAAAAPVDAPPGVSVRTISLVPAPGGVGVLAVDVADVPIFAGSANLTTAAPRGHNGKG